MECICIGIPDKVGAHSTGDTPLSVQPLRDQSRTPAEQSGCKYNASRQCSSLPNCEVVQRGMKLLGLDCAAGGRVERSRREVQHQAEGDASHNTGWETTQGRKQRARLTPDCCQHNSSYCFFFQ